MRPQNRLRLNKPSNPILPVGRPRRQAAHTRYKIANLSGLLTLVTLLVACTGSAAWADLKLCNSTSSRVGVSIGYKDANGWATEGWWNIASRTCETLLKGALPSRFVYVHAVDYDRGGEWVGSNFMCTQEKSFSIRGVKECEDRGYRRTGFFEVDTGDSKIWTIRLTDPETGASDTR